MIQINFDELEAAVESNSYLGYCLVCGAEHYFVDPNARNDKCEECGERMVFGAEEILISHPEVIRQDG